MPFALRFTSFAILTCLAAAASGAEDEKVDYTTQVKPIFTHHCTVCHGALKQKSGLRLDAGSLIHKGGESGPAVVPHKPDDSLLIHSVTGKDGVEKMPMEGAPLSAAQVALLKKWIEQGAPFPKEEKTPSDPAKHWAFQPVVKPAIPKPRNEAWSKHPIDAFIAAEHEARGLTPVAEAPALLLIRRLYLDLTGLPPTPAELEAAFHAVVNASPTNIPLPTWTIVNRKAFEALADQLLASPRHAERWARHWMDVWRYSDWYGYGNELRNSQKHMWRFRDWIIESLQKDTPYDRMIVQMLAADETFPTDESALRAMGFLTRSYYKFSRHVWLDNIVEHTGKAFLGVTMNCARCHDHMYDPIAQAEYYQMRAVFEPHQLRVDRVPGQSDVEKDGISRVYDADAAAQTFLFERGNEMNPVKDKPLPPGVPKALAVSAGELTIAPVTLPVQAYFAGAKTFIREEAIAAAKANVDARSKAYGGAQQALADAVKRRSDAKFKEDEQKLNDAVESATQAEAIAFAHLAAARAQQDATEARIAADLAKAASPPAKNVAELAAEAARLQRKEAMLTADAALAEARKAVADAERPLRSIAANAPEKAKLDKALDEAKKKLAEAQKRATAASAELAKTDGNYTPLSPSYPATSTGRRLALANWIASKKNPLTARVAVNHIWMRHFGQPLVPTVFDFGLNGREPSHPQLLDFLAAELMESNWSMRHVHRLIVTSKAYRLASAAAEGQRQGVKGQGTADAASVSASSTIGPRAVDPDNRYLWRMNPRRLEAEAIRDSLIHIAGKLDTSTGGPELDQNAGMTTYRRSLYYRHALEKQMTFLTVFDMASPVECYRRAETIVPQQALALANSPLALDMARTLAAALTKQCGEPGEATDSAFIDAAYQRVLSRPPSDAERSECLAFLAEQSKALAAPANHQPFTGGGKPTVKPATNPAQRAREDLVHVLINHHEFVTIR